MQRILKLEFIKTIGYPAFRAIVVLHAILFLLVVLVGSQIDLGVNGIRVDRLFAFPHVWSTLAWVGSWFNLLLGILVITLVGNEHQFRTFRKQIIDGVSRPQLLVAKMAVIGTLSVYATLLVVISGLAFGILFTENLAGVSILSNVHLVLVLFVQAFAYMMMGMLAALLFKNNALSIMLFLLFYFIIEPILRVFFPSSIDQFFPVKIIANLTPMPDFVGITAGDLIQINGATPTNLYSMGILQEPLSVGYATLVCMGYILVFYIVCRLIVLRRNF